MSLRWILAVLVATNLMAIDIESLRKKAEAGDAMAQCDLGYAYEKGNGVPVDYNAAVHWYRKAAAQNNPIGLNNVGAMYSSGLGVSRDDAEAVKWYRKAAERGSEFAQNNLGVMLMDGRGVSKDLVEAYRWFYISARQGHLPARENAEKTGVRLTASEKEQAQRAGDAFLKGHRTARSDTGTGFFITTDGYLLTCRHVIKNAVRIIVRRGSETLTAEFVKADDMNDLALLKVNGKFRPLPLASSRDVRLGEPVFTVGFPNPNLMGVSPKLTDGTVNSLAGELDDPRYFQVNAAIQPGNSGGPLMNSRGSVVGVLARTYGNMQTVERIGGVLPQNVNYAVKSSYALAFLESVPDALGKLVAPRSGTKRPLEELAPTVQDATVLVVAE
jgi:S1-C subfamily serine protease